MNRYFPTYIAKDIELVPSCCAFEIKKKLDKTCENIAIFFSRNNTCYVCKISDFYKISY